MRAIAIAIALSSAVLGLAAPAAAFTLRLSNLDFITTPVFSNVQDFSFEIDVRGPLVAGGVYDNASIRQVQYLVRGNLSTNPPTPSGFPAFRLDRTDAPNAEGPISPTDWIDQGSSIAFAITTSADLSDGLQLSELVPGAAGLLFELDAREFERLDRARYHPPLLKLFGLGTGLLQNSNNSSGSTGTTNPATGMTVDVDFGEEYITQLRFDPSAITLVVPEPGTGLLLGIGLLGLGRQRKRAGSLQ
jgi:hypothetical protein